MKFLVRFCSCALLAVVLSGVAGCRPIGQVPGDEEKEPHFITGKSRVNALDFKGAISAFEKALENNPASAAAHFELGWIFDQKQPDPAAAIYHYEKFLQLRPKAENAEVIRERILASKQELARTVTLGPVTEKQRRDLEKLLEENKRLNELNRQLNDENLRLQMQLAARDSTTSSGPVTMTAERSPAGTATPGSRSGSTPSAGPGRTTTSSQPSTSSLSGSRTGFQRFPARRTHVVRQGETMMSVSRRYGVRLESLRAANPGVEPRKLRPGTVLNVP